MGKATAASPAAFCATSFKMVKLALLVGVCGGVPIGKDNKEILLGDVIISKGVMQYDLGRQFSDGFRRKIDVQHSLGRPNARISSLLAKLETQIHERKLQEQITHYLTQLPDPVFYPGAHEDKLFPADYQHKHHRLQDCTTCAACIEPTDPICRQALVQTCTQISCDDTHLVQRFRTNERYRPSIHIGLIASGDSVIKSGRHRDAISSDTGAIGFEMEGAEVWDTIPCVFIKGVCDYADSHKNKLWQAYAAATAAACAKAFAQQW
ncbi:nucleoside phosphorylase domain-containing protein [Aspergillus karnatakaensis]|uniref:nucleoside phosphorylase domain-containing protein n=1 Tax=Aspergillus karnatakaensis TaxID=1810916 RepID=UPI003CCDD32A